jgi:hypothetical protein
MNEIKKSFYSFDIWLEVVKSFHLNIEDLCKMNQGDYINLIFLGDCCLPSEIKKGDGDKIVSAEDFFKDVKVYTYVHYKDYKGMLKMGKEWKNFDWEVEYMGNFIEPFENISKLSRIGWKGPCIPYKYLKFCPDIKI